ncbi:MAG: ABC transporter permease [Bacilli bacterium]|nr:ABC transporter permease [Bacilli bacterium]
MATYIIGYTIIALVVIFVVFVELVGHKLICRNSPRIQNIFGHPLLMYSLKRIGSAIISILLAITATFFLIRFKVEAGNGQEFCQQVIKNWSKMNDAIRQAQCVSIKADLGITTNWFADLFTYFFNILPFPKTVCLTEYGTEIVDGTINYIITTSNCRTTVMNLGRIFFIEGDVGKYVTDVIFERMGVSFQVGIIACAVEVVLGYPAGILMAKHKDGIFDKIGKTYIISIDAIPGVAYYYIWMVILCTLIGLPRTYEDGNFLSLLAPALTMGFTGMAGISLWVRRFMLDEFNSDYVKFARSKGLSENRILYTHVLRNAIVPLVRSIPAAVLGALLGTFYLEKIYGINGIGGLLVVAHGKSDFYALQGIIIISALISIVSYLLGDIVTAIVDPRVSFSDE